ncbi:MAG: hypothetical protein ABIH71_02635 [Candidatus Omnitrophota bacterium]
MVTTRGDVRIPAVVAHLQPVLRENKIFVLGKIVVNNPTESVLELKPIYLKIEDADNNVLSRSVLEWQMSYVKSKEELAAEVEIAFDLSILNQEYINVEIKTEFIYKKLGLSIPVEEKIAVVDLRALKDTIRKPLRVSVFTKFYPEILGNVSVQYELGITNPVSIDLLLENGQIAVYPTSQSKGIKTVVPSALFKGEEKTSIQGLIKFEKDVGARVIAEFIKGNPVKVEVSGNLRLPDTEIFMPFKVESSQELDLSLFRIGGREGQGRK